MARFNRTLGVLMSLPNQVNRRVSLGKGPELLLAPCHPAPVWFAVVPPINLHRADGALADMFET